MFRNLKRFVNKNTVIVFISIAIFVILIILIQFLNNFAKQGVTGQVQQNSSSGINSTTTSSNTYSNETGQISGTTVNSDVTEENKKIINNFVNLCNNGKVEEAYQCLSSNCKEVVFNNKIENFKNNYFEKIFKEEKLANINLWIKNGNRYTYKIVLTNNVLASGSYDEKVTEDYYTIVTDRNTKKLAINKYIDKIHINKEQTLNEINIKIEYKQLYYSYEIYRINVENNTKNLILIDSQAKQDTICLIDEDKNEYGAYLSELYDENLKIDVNQAKQMDIKFDKLYSNNKNIKKIKFSDIVLNVNDYKNTLKIEIDI